MNERIEKLWDEAAKLESDSSWAGQTRFMEKFAELIVRECVKICQDHPSIIFKNEWDADVVSPDIVSRLESHFGVKEPKGWVCSKCGIDRTKAACPKGHTAALTGECPMIGVAQ